MDKNILNGLDDTSLLDNINYPTNIASDSDKITEVETVPLGTPSVV